MVRNFEKAAIFMLVVLTGNKFKMTELMKNISCLMNVKILLVFGTHGNRCIFY